MVSWEFQVPGKYITTTTKHPLRNCIVVTRNMLLAQLKKESLEFFRLNGGGDDIRAVGSGRTEMIVGPTV